MTKISTDQLENITESLIETTKINSTQVSFEFFKYAPRADVAVMGRIGGTSVLITIVCGRERSDMGYFPLQVEYIERLYAGGRIKGSRFVKREGRPSDEAVLTARMIDRSIRPLFPKDFYNEVQVIATVMSVDGQNDPGILANLTTQVALHVSDIPWQGPSTALRLGLVEDQIVINPTIKQMKTSRLDLIVSATPEAVVMIEAGADQIDNQTLMKALKRFYQAAGPLFDLSRKLRDKIGRPKREYQPYQISETALKAAQTKQVEIDELIAQMAKKQKSQSDWDQIRSQWTTEFSQDNEADLVADYEAALTQLMAKSARRFILENKRRLDGRELDEIRPLHIEVGLLPQVHGSAMFQRGQTQVLSTLTLASPSMEQIIETMLEDEFKRYMHHYSALPYSVGETGRVGWPRRREIGHGALAEKALVPVLPSEDEFPYTIRIVSEVLSQQGSTSMASTCGSSLALMDAGVPIKAPVAGISIGMVSDDKDYLLLTDIMGIEDHTGDMDFKVAGTRNGVTAIQLDVKKIHLTLPMIEAVLERAYQARLAILSAMQSVIDKPRTKLAETAPKIAVTYVPEDKIGDVIGSGGQVIKRIIKETETLIDVGDDGRVVISGESRDNVNKAKEIIEGISRDINVGEVFAGRIVRLVDFGAFVELYPGRDGLLHISKIPGYVEDINRILKEGQVIKVRVDEVTPEGKLSLSLAGPIPGYVPQDRPAYRNTHNRRPQGRPTSRFHRKTR